MVFLLHLYDDISTNEMPLIIDFIKKISYEKSISFTRKILEVKQNSLIILIFSNTKITLVEYSDFSVDFTIYVKSIIQL